MNHIKLILTAIAFLYAPHAIIMIGWEFITWGNAVWYISEWSEVGRALWGMAYLFYILLTFGFIKGVL